MRQQWYGYPAQNNHTNTIRTSGDNKYNFSPQDCDNPHALLQKGVINMNEYIELCKKCAEQHPRGVINK